MPTISLRTVYQTLNDLAAMGELNALDLGTGSTRFDPTVEPHHHMVCDSCGRIVAVHADLPVVPPVDGEGGFTVTRSEERRVGKECVSTCRSRGSLYT